MARVSTTTSYTGRLIRSGEGNLSWSLDGARVEAGESLQFDSRKVNAFVDQKRKNAAFEIHAWANVAGAVLLAEVLPFFYFSFVSSSVYKSCGLAGTTLLVQQTKT